MGFLDWLKRRSVWRAFQRAVRRAFQWAGRWRPPSPRRFWKIAMIAAAALGAAFLLLIGAVHAQTVCDSHSAVIEKLENTYRETRAGVGLASNGAVAQLYVSESGSWTMLLTNARGVACLIAAGQGWESKAPNREGEAESDS
ncbi:MAG: hypothetical protein QNJ84_17280 [Alphaproteobacteria bacterium]|nr:hypothetical protein [Alphaproteobacteria bacterium]